jgi:hypothetical protein
MLNRTASALALLALAASLIIPLRANDRDDDRRDLARDFRVRIGFHISPVPLDLKQKNPALVGLGSYLVNATGGCNDCHTWPNYAPGGDPFQGQPEKINVQKYLAGGREFPTPGGTFISKNITPDENGRPGGLTRREFLSLIRTGHDPDSPDPNSLLQVMPWPVYRHMTDTDLSAIYEYLRSIPSLPNNY